MLLKITKPDGVIHVANPINKGFYEQHNRRLKSDQKWLIEEVTEEEAKSLPYQDPNHVRPADAVKVLATRDKEIADLRAQLAAAKRTEGQAKVADPGNVEHMFGGGTDTIFDGPTAEGADEENPVTDRQAKKKAKA